MHVSLARLAAGCVAATTLAALAGCNPTPAAQRPAGHTGIPRALYLLVGVHRNEPRPGIPQAVAPLLETAVRHAEPITVIAVDGEPRIVYRSPPYTISTSSDSAADDDVATETNAVLAAVTHATARADGDNLAKAVSVAADDAASIGVQHPTDVVIDSGASDRGAVVMTTPSMTSAVPSEVAGFVSAAGTLPKLSGTHFVEVGFGYTSAPQAPLSLPQQQTIREIWRSVLELQGATVTVLPVPRTGTGPTTPFTTGTIAADPSPAYRPAAVGTTVFGPQSPLGFVPGTASFADPQGAERQIRAWAAWITARPGRVAHIIGTCAGTGSTASQRRLSTSRAETVAASLTAAGVPSRDVLARGVGINFPQYVPDVTGGVLNPVKAQLNRTVRVTLEQR